MSRGIFYELSRSGGASGEWDFAVQIWIRRLTTINERSCLKCHILIDGEIAKENEMRELGKKAAAWFAIKSESGVTAIEYGLVAALIAIVIITAVTSAGTNLNTVFKTIGTKLASAI